MGVTGPLCKNFYFGPNISTHFYHHVQCSYLCSPSTTYLCKQYIILEGMKIQQTKILHKSQVKKLLICFQISTSFVSFFIPRHISKWCFKHPKLILLIFLFIFSVFFWKFRSIQVFFQLALFQNFSTSKSACRPFCFAVVVFFP